MPFNKMMSIAATVPLIFLIAFVAIPEFFVLQSYPNAEGLALERLKKEAASLGANGLVIQNISTNIKQHLSFNENDKGQISGSSRQEKQKELNAIAIFVK